MPEMTREEALKLVNGVTAFRHLADILLSVDAKARADAVAEYIDQNSVNCDCCGHVMIDVTAAKDGSRQHCIAGDSEGEGVACAHGMQHDKERLLDELASALAPAAEVSR